MTALEGEMLRGTIACQRIYRSMTKGTTMNTLVSHDYSHGDRCILKVYRLQQYVYRAVDKGIVMFTLGKTK